MRIYVGLPLRNRYHHNHHHYHHPHHHHHHRAHTNTHTHTHTHSYLTVPDFRMISSAKVWNHLHLNSFFFFPFGRDMDIYLDVDAALNSGCLFCKLKIYRSLKLITPVPNSFNSILLAALLTPPTSSSSSALM